MHNKTLHREVLKSSARTIDQALLVINQVVASEKSILLDYDLSPGKDKEKTLASEVQLSDPKKSRFLTVNNVIDEENERIANLQIAEEDEPDDYPEDEWDKAISSAPPFRHAITRGTPSTYARLRPTGSSGTPFKRTFPSSAKSTAVPSAQDVKRNLIIKCYNCSKLGHFARVCTSEVVCRNCGQTGHIARDCPSPAKPRFQTSVATL
jgi:hypothetical protein